MVYTPVVGEACAALQPDLPEAPRPLPPYPHATGSSELLANRPRSGRGRDRGDRRRADPRHRRPGRGRHGHPGRQAHAVHALRRRRARTDPPVLLDVGTNNADRLADPHYLGWRHERVGGDAYDDFVEASSPRSAACCPGVLLQWEDFAHAHAAPLLERYRDRLCTFNDDIQGTAAVALAALADAVSVTGGPAARPAVVIARRRLARAPASPTISPAMRPRACPPRGAAAVLAGRPHGLLHDGPTDLDPRAAALRPAPGGLAGWPARRGREGAARGGRGGRPTVAPRRLGQRGRFTEAACGRWPRPSSGRSSSRSPTRLARARPPPADLLAWTDGRALVATGSPSRR